MPPEGVYPSGDSRIAAVSGNHAIREKVRSVKIRRRSVDRSKAHIVLARLALLDLIEIAADLIYLRARVGQPVHFIDKVQGDEQRQLPEVRMDLGAALRRADTEISQVLSPLAPRPVL